MKTLMIAVLIVIFLSTGCTMYDVKRDPSGIVNVKVRSTRSFEAPDLSYSKDDGSGAVTKFDFKAANADNNTDAILGIFGGVMQMMQQMMLQMATPEVPQ